MKSLLFLTGVFALVAIVALPSASALAPFPNVWATTSPPSGFPFPRDFHATQAIALYDTNQNGFLDRANRSLERPFPVGFPPLHAFPGGWIGSTLVVPQPNDDSLTLAQLLALGKFCGDILIYAEQVDQGNNIAYFLWFALKDPNRPAKPPPCNSTYQVDFGLGSYQNTYQSPTNIRHASFFGGGRANTSLGEVRLSIGQAGTVAAPGHIFSVSPDPTAAWPAALSGGFVAAEIGAFENTLVPVSGIVIDVPFIDEAQWDGQSFFTTAYPYARSISPLSSVPPLLLAPAQSFQSWLLARLPAALIMTVLPMVR